MVPVRLSRFGALAVVALIAATLVPSGGAGTAPPGPWRIVPSPNLGTIDNHLQEVSCVNNVRCVAVGFNQNATTLLRRSVAATLLGRNRFRTAVMTNSLP